MTTKTAIATSQAPRPGGAYSQGVIANGFVFTAGMGPVDPETGSIVGDTTEEQTRVVLENVSAVLDASGCSMADVVKVTAHLANLEDFAQFDGVFRDFFDDPLPVRTTVGSTLPGILVEIDAVAVA